MCTNRIWHGYLLAGVAATGLVVPIGALAQDAANSAASPNTAVQPPQAAADALQEVTVTGFRKS